MVGGYDFVHGYAGTVTGDLFLDIDGNFQIVGGGYSNTIVQNNFGYEYVVDLDFSGKAYNVYELNSSSRVKNVTHEQNQPSNPWCYYDSGTLVTSGMISYWANLPSSEAGGFVALPTMPLQSISVFSLPVLSSTRITPTHAEMTTSWAMVRLLLFLNLRPCSCSRRPRGTCNLHPEGCQETVTMRTIRHRSFSIRGYPLKPALSQVNGP